jgi:hypothetical protein
VPRIIDVAIVELRSGGRPRLCCRARRISLGPTTRTASRVGTDASTGCTPPSNAFLARFLASDRDRLTVRKIRHHERRHVQAGEDFPHVGVAVQEGTSVMVPHAAAASSGGTRPHGDSPWRAKKCARAGPRPMVELIPSPGTQTPCAAICRLLAHERIPRARFPEVLDRAQEASTGTPSNPKSRNSPSLRVLRGMHTAAPMGVPWEGRCRILSWGHPAAFVKADGPGRRTSGLAGASN